MQRLINVYHNDNKNLLDNYENVDVSDIHNIINYSVDFIRFNDIGLFEYKISEQIIAILLNKLRLNGSLMLCLSDTKNISRLYADSAMSDHDFLDKIQNIRSIWSQDLLIKFIEDSHKDSYVSKIQRDHKNHLVYITITRKSL